MTSSCARDAAKANFTSKLLLTVQMYLLNGNTSHCECCYPDWAKLTPNYTFLIPSLEATSMPDLWSRQARPVLNGTSGQSFHALGHTLC